MADRLNYRIQIFSSSGLFLNKFRIEDDDSNFQFIRIGVTVDTAGNIFVANSNTGQIMIFNSSGIFLNKFGTFGDGNGEFLCPTDLAPIGSNRMIVTDTKNSRAVVLTYLISERVKLSINSDFGNPVGAGLHIKDTVANWFVTTPCPNSEGENGIRYIADSVGGNVKMDADKLINVDWTKQLFLNLVSEKNRGNPIGEGWYDSGTEVTWTVTSPVIEAPKTKRYVTDLTAGTFVINDPITINVNWTTQWYLDVEKDGGGTINIMRKWYDNLEPVQLTASELSTHEFKKWVITDDTSATESTSNPIEFLIKSPRNMLAVFAIKDGQTLTTAPVSLQSGWNLKSFNLYPESTQFTTALNNTFTGKIWAYGQDGFTMENYLSSA